MTDATPSLSGIELFDGLGASDRDALARLCRWHRYTAHQYIIGHQDESNDVYFIVGGRVRVTIFSPSGKEVSFRDLPAGKCFGELSAIDGAPRSATVIALSDTVLASMSAEAFRRVLNDRPDVAAKVMQYLTGLVRKLSARVYDFSAHSVNNRVQNEILRLARLAKPTGNTTVISPAPTHAEIASRVNTHREAVTKEIGRLARAGLIEKSPRKLVVRDFEALRRMAEEILD